MSDSITWRVFCRIGIDRPVPHPTTLMKLTTRCGSVAVDGLNEALLAKAAEAKLLRTTRVRADTTVVPSNVAYPTDSGLLAKAVGGSQRPDGGSGPRAAPRTRLRDRSRAAGKRAHRSPRSCDLRPRRGGTRPRPRSAQAPVSSPTWPRPPPRTRVGYSPTRSGRCGRRGPAPPSGRPRPAATRRPVGVVVAWRGRSTILRNCWGRPGGSPPNPATAGWCTPDGVTRRVSLHDPHARPIAKGRLGKPVEFGHKAQVVDNDDGIVLDHAVAAR